MGKGLAGVITSLSDTGKALTALGFVASTAVAVTLLVVSFVGVPAEVAANTDAIRAHAVRIDNLEDADLEAAEKLDRILCILTQPDSLTHIQVERACR